MTYPPRVLPTSPLAPAGDATIVLLAGQQPVFPLMNTVGSQLYAADFAQIGAPGDPVIQAEASMTPAGLLGSLDVTWDNATVLFEAEMALGAGSLCIALSVLFGSGAAFVQQIILPVAPGVGVTPAPAGALTLNGFALTVGGQPVALSGAGQPLTIDQSPLTIGSAPILLEG